MRRCRHVTIAVLALGSVSISARVFEVESGKMRRDWAIYGDDWLTIGADGHYRGTYAALEHLHYFDPNHDSDEPAFWFANDLPHLHAPDAPPLDSPTSEVLR